MGTVGIKEPETRLESKVYPNPANKLITVETENTNIRNARIVLYDLSGKKVFEKQLNHSVSNKTNIKLDGLEQGLYLYKIVAGNKVSTGKFIKHRYSRD